MNRKIDDAIKVIGPYRRVALACAFAFANVRGNTRRVALAALGVAIGFAAVISMLVIGHSVTAQAERALVSMGGDIMTLSFIPRDGERTPTDHATPPMDSREVDAMAARAEVLLRAMPEVDASVRVESLPPCSGSSETPLARLDLISASPQIQHTLSLKMAKGRFLHDLDGARGWAVLGSEAGRELAPGGSAPVPGDSIEVCGKTLQIAGVLARYDGDELLPTLKINSSLIILPALAERLGALGTPQLLVRVRDNAGVIDLSQLLPQRLSAVAIEPVAAQGARRFAEMKHEQVVLFTRFLAMLGAVSLVVGSLGVANVMLVSVVERRAEIGLRAAVGARPVDIALQFVIESLLICLSGSMAGFVLGLIGSASALALARIEFSIGADTLVAVAVLVLASGVTAGLYPAVRASRLDPATTLQGS